MTRHDYVALPAAMRLCRPKDVFRPEGIMWLACVFSLAQSIARDNPKFDSDRFTAACGVGEA